MTKKTKRAVNENPPPPDGPRPKPSAAPPPPPVDQIVLKLVQSVRAGDVLVIECDELRTQPQLEHLHRQLKAKLPEMRIVILNKGAHVANAQTIATLAGAAS
jgi:hypothetical protein